MARLSEETLNEGRALIRTHDLDGLVAWVKRTRVLIDVEVTRKTFERLFRAGNTERALKLFDVAFLTADPAREWAIFGAKIAFTLFVILGLLGGVVSLFR